MTFGHISDSWMANCGMPVLVDKKYATVETWAAQCNVFYRYREYQFVQ